VSKAWDGGSDTRWRVFRAAVLSRDRYLCTIRDEGCTTHAPLRGGHVDHIQPLSKGGAKYDMTNARAACASCNIRRGDRAPVPQPEPRPTSSW
jgi:5-methylcytosine-specific restriction endonuclease McrA